jgi:hypothetical protein
MQVKANKPKDSDREHWWRNWPGFKLTPKGRAVAKPGAELLFDVCWAGKIYSAWVYELVRRLPHFHAIGKRIPLDQLRSLKGLPPYVDLPAGVKIQLQRILEPGPPVLRREGHTTPVPKGYTDPLPPWAFNLHNMSRKAFLRFMGRWFDAQQRAKGLQPGSGRKGGRSRNRQQDYRFGDWLWIELSGPNRLGRRYSRREQCVRARAKRLGIQHYRHVLTAVTLGSLPLTSNLATPRPIPELEAAPKKKYTFDEVVALFVNARRTS